MTCGLTKWKNLSYENSPDDFLRQAVQRPPHRPFMQPVATVLLHDDRLLPPRAHENAILPAPSAAGLARVRYSQFADRCEAIGRISVWCVRTGRDLLLAEISFAWLGVNPCRHNF